jgi:5-methylcytosine-specific restriction endonuclease McrA
VANIACSITDCGSPLVARGWCSKHYTRWKRYGDPVYRIPGEVRDGKRVCPRCQVDKSLADYSPANKVCRPCMAARKRSKPLPEVIPQPPVYCVECGVRFTPATRQVICCSAVCSNARKRRFDAEYMAVRCREAANESTRRWYAANRDKAFDNSARYRARKANALVDDVDRLVVFERDNWICQLCGEPVDRSASYPDPRTPSVDHRVPLSKGGAHSYENCQTACLLCNVQKGARM